MIPSLKEIARLHEIEAGQHCETQNPRTIPKQTKPPILATTLCHATRDLLGQCLGRTAGLGIFTAITHATWSPVSASILVGSAGAIAAGTQAFLISRHQIGISTLAHKTAVSLCTVTGAVVGASIVALGSSQPVIALAIGVAATTAVSLVKFCLHTQPDADELSDTAKATVFGMTTATSLVTYTLIHPSWLATEKTIASRSIGVMIESSIVELCKASFERLGPSVNRGALTFNGKVISSLMGLLPYVAASVLLNGYVSGLMQPAHDSHEFMDLWAPLMIGALSNAVRGASNSAAVFYLQQKQVQVSDPNAKLIRPSQGVLQPNGDKVGQKTCVRMFLSCCRNALYFHLRERGMTVLQASCLAQFSYAFFAQSRDLIFDLMQGEGWTEPRITARLDPAQ
jgi:hypothetical protein